MSKTERLATKLSLTLKTKRSSDVERKWFFLIRVASFICKIQKIQIIKLESQSEVEKNLKDSNRTQAQKKSIFSFEREVNGQGDSFEIQRDEIKNHKKV